MEAIDEKESISSRYIFTLGVGIYFENLFFLTPFWCTCDLSCDSGEVVES